MPTTIRHDRKRPRPATAPLSYRLSDCASLVGISVSGLRNLIRDGRLRAVRHGRITLIPAAELHRLAGSEVA